MLRPLAKLPLSISCLLASLVTRLSCGESLASGPAGTPAIYNANMPSGSRWSNTGLYFQQNLRHPTSHVYTILIQCFSPMHLSSLLVPIPISTSTRPRSSPPPTPPRSYTHHLTFPPPSVRTPPGYLPPSLMAVHTSTSPFLPAHTLVPQTPQLLILQSFLPVAGSLPMP